MTKGKMRIYGCGGGGINQASRYDTRQPFDGAADIAVTYIDTSLSNSVEGANDRTVIVPNVNDGSGAVRRENVEPIRDSVPSILLDHPPLDMNVVIYTAHGGTGSVAGPVIHSELLKRKVPVLSIIIGGEESANKLNNTISTLETVQGIVRARQANMAYAYYHNDPAKSRTEVDEQVECLISGLAVLASRQNEELDTRDLYNWLQFCEVPGPEGEPIHPPVPVRLRLITDDLVKNHLERQVLSRASLLMDPATPQPGWVSDYDTTGYCDLKHVMDDKSLTGMHFILTHELNTQFKELIERRSTVWERRQARTSHRSILADDKDVGDDGLVGV